MTTFRAPALPAQSWAEIRKGGEAPLRGKDECVFPMVPAGGANTDMILEPPTRTVRDKAEKSQTGFE